MNDQSKLGGLSEGELSLFFARLITKAYIVLIVVAIISAIQMFRLGVTTRYVLLIAGPLLSMAVLFACALLIAIERGAPKRSLVRSSIALSGFIPYLFGCYLTFYEGFWRMRLLLDDFSMTVFGIALLYIVGGFVVVSTIYKVSEFGRAVTAGRPARS